MREQFWALKTGRNNTRGFGTSLVRPARRHPCGSIHHSAILRTFGGDRYSCALRILVIFTGGFKEKWRRPHKVHNVYEQPSDFS